VETSDVRVAEDIMMFALFKEVRKPERRKKRKLNHGGGANFVESEDSDESEEEFTDQRMSIPSKATKLLPPQPSEQPQSAVSAATTRISSGPLSGRWVSCCFKQHMWLTFMSSVAIFKQRLGQLMAGSFADEDAIPIQDLIPAVNDGLPSEALFGPSEAIQCAEVMNETNDIMFSDNIVYKL
jgi:DNA replication licensing factor MCM3